MRLIIAMCICFLLVPPLAAQEESDLPGPSKVRWLVGFEGSVSDEDIRQLAASIGVDARNPGPYTDFWLFRFSGPPSEEQLEQLAELDGVTFFEQEVRYRTTRHTLAADPDDPLAVRQWNLRMLDLETAYYFNFGADPSITIAILDSGVNYLNTPGREMAPDLAGTIVYEGYDFVSDDRLALDEGDGKIGHGTFMAGVVAQTTFNRRGTAGIAFNAALQPIRVVNRRGVARAGDLAAGIRFAAVSGARIILLGVAGPDDSVAVRRAVDFAWKNGVAVIAPAGNAQQVQYPARYERVISVGAVDAAGKRAWYSPTVGPVDMYAPGGDLRPGIDADEDGYPDGILGESFQLRNINEYETIVMEGTSAAAAQVAGVAALILSHAGPMHPDQLRAALLRSAERHDKLPLINAGRSLIRLTRTIQ